MFAEQGAVRKRDSCALQRDRIGRLLNGGWVPLSERPVRTQCRLEALLGPRLRPIQVLDPLDDPVDLRWFRRFEL